MPCITTAIHDIIDCFIIGASAAFWLFEIGGLHLYDFLPANTYPLYIIPSVMPFNVIVVGAGISGLASAISLRRHGNVVTVYEAGPALSEAGAGLQIPPNSFRLLDQLGVGDRLRGSSVKPKASIYKMYSTGDVIKVNPLNPQLEEVFGAP